MDTDIVVLEKLKDSEIPMSLRVYEGHMEQQILLGYEIDNSILRTKDPLDIIPILGKTKIIEVRFYLSHHIHWFYDYCFLIRHEMQKDIEDYIREFQNKRIIYLARRIRQYKELKESRIIKTLKRHSNILNSYFSNNNDNKNIKT